ncbi:MAG: single-stranded DNA-binding protein [Niabella sp.]
MIKMQVIGNLGRDCIVNNVNGRNVINFTVAHTERFRDSQGNNQERTTWVDCAYWTDRTNVAQYLTRGKQVYAEGTPEVRSFTRNDGSAGASLTLRVREVQLLGGRAEGAAPAPGGGYGSATNVPSSPAQSSGMPPAVEPPIEDDLPF